MTITKLDLTDRELYPLNPTQQAARIWTRPTWSDPWTLRTDLQVTQAVWSAYPEISTASLHYRYGWVTLPGTADSVALEPITARGYWVLIAFPADDSDDELTWLGYAEYPITVDHTPARTGVIETGTQTVPCYGLEVLWDQAPIDGTVAVDPDDANHWKRYGNVPATFNATDRGNRTDLRRELTSLSTRTAHAFSNPTDPPHNWTTKTIVEHLLTFYAPTADRLLPNTDVDPTTVIPWTYAGLTKLPDWDAPRVRTQGRSVGDVLRELVTPGRMTSLRIHPTVDLSEDLPSVTAVTLQFHSHLTSSITIPGIDDPLPFTADGTAIVSQDDPLTWIRHTIDASDVVDQIIVQGPPEISVCTLRVSAGQLQKAWVPGEEGDYTDGAVDDPAWATWSQSERQAANARVRSTDRLNRVFRDLELDRKFSGTVDVNHSVFPDAESGTEPVDPADFYSPYLGLIELLPDLPLLEGIDYTPIAGDVDEGAGINRMGIKRRPILISLENPITNKRDVLEFIGDPKFLPGRDIRQFRLRVQAINQPRPGIRMEVRGGPRLMIAPSIGNEADGKGMDAYDYTTLQATVAMRGDRRPSWTYPADSELDAMDAQRRRTYVFDTPLYELVYIPISTIVSIDTAGDPQTAEGGILRDPLPKLKAIAELLGKHQNVPRHRIVISTPRRLGSLPIGTILRTVDAADDTDIKTPVIEVRIEAPADAQPGEAVYTQTITAAAHTLDILAAVHAGGQNA